MKNFDVAIIGAGPGGYVAAIRCAQLGLKTCVIEREHMGGICLNWGCIPTKALLKASEVKMAIDHAADFGITAQITAIDPVKLIGRSRDVAAKLNAGIGFLMKKNKVETIMGTAKFKTKNTLTVTTKDGAEEVTAKNIIIATGARARQIPGVLEADGKHIWTYKEAMTPTAIPASLLVIGAGAIGIEFASFYAAFGTKVTVVEAQDRILPVEDADISAIAQKALQKRGLELLVKAKVEDLKATKDGVSAKVNGEVRSFDRAILAIGVHGNIENLGLEDLGIKTERGSVVVDDYYRTNVEGVWAIGDVAGAPWLAHVASHEGVICAEAIAGKNPHKMDYGSIPGCTYCTPQIGSVGMTEAAAREAGRNIKVGRYNYQANGKAIAIGEPEGLVKTIFDADTGELLGAHIIGAEATEMISTYQVAKGLEATSEAFAQICLPHPTLSEMLGEAVLDSLGRVINA